MLVEHSFVTTMDAPEALGAASELLTHMGFAVGSASDQRLDATRGRATPSRNTHAGEWPQRVRVEFDRGRVNVAASISEPHKPIEPANRMLMVLATALERRLARQEPIETLLGDWQDANAAVIQHRAAQRRRGCTVLIVVAAVVVSLIALAMMAA